MIRYLIYIVNYEISKTIICLKSDKILMSNDIFSQIKYLINNQMFNIIIENNMCSR